MRARHMLLAMLRCVLSDNPITEEEKKELFAPATQEDWQQIITMCEMQKVGAVLFEALGKNKDIAVPEQTRTYLKQSAYTTSMRYYRMIAAMKQILALLKEQNITYYLLKGAGLSTMYPKEELRSFGDLDIYIPNPEEVKRAQKLFDDLGCEREPSFSVCHTVYFYSRNGCSCELEVHWKLTADFNNGDIDEKLEKIYSIADGKDCMLVYPMMTEVRMLPVTLNALHILAHMLQHFMSSGFGLKLFCDWTMFWQKHGQSVDLEQFMGWIKELHLENFLYAVTGVCVKYLGLPEEICPWMTQRKRDDEMIESLLQDVMTGGEHGKYDSTRMLVTSRAPGLGTYAWELHRQMKRRFKKLGKIFLLWPILWVLTGVIYVYNNRMLRNVSTKTLMDSNKKRNQLVQKLDIFEKK